MGSSSGLILADQTGIGKGRTVASIIRWAVLQGKVAIFVTQKETLFIDMIRDLKAIDFHKHPIFVINTNIIKVDGKDISSNKNKDIYKNEKIIFTTYSQIQRGADGWKTQRLKMLSKGAILILDEAHEAAASVGAINDNPNAINSDKESNRYKFLSSLYGNIEGALFSSATYAKRPDNLMLYYPFTDLNNFAYNKLLEMLKGTGSIGQALVSNALVESGQLIRRESSYKGIIFNDLTTPDLVKLIHNDKQKEDDEHQFIANTWDKIAYVLKDIVEFERKFKPTIMYYINESVKESGSGKIAGDNTMKADSSNFTAVMHNTIKQLDLSLKARSIAEYAIKLVESGQKVLIYLHYTNKSFFSENFKLGDKVEDNISLVLIRNWKRILEYSIKDSNKLGATSTKYTITMSQLEMVPDAKEFYMNILKKIENLNVSVPLSAIDYFHSALNKKGIKTLEITGRTEKLDYLDGKKYVTRKKEPTAEVSDLFNNTNDHNVIIFNASGSTGISLHASKEFKSQSKRHMIVAQPNDDINTYMQAFGRINRTGQIVLPEYTFVSIPIPVSNRIRIVLRKKLASLNANVKGSAKDENSMKDIIDMANEHGDDVTFSYLMDAYRKEPDEAIQSLNEMLNDPCHIKIKEKRSSYNAFLKVTGRLPILSIKEQENFYDQITDKFLGYMEDLKRAGISLEETAMDLQAKTVHVKNLLPKSGNNIFQQECNLETVEIKTEHPDLNEIYDTLDYDRESNVISEFEKELENWKAEKSQQSVLTNKDFALTKDQEILINKFHVYIERFKIGSIHEWKEEKKSSGETQFELMLVKDIRYTPRKNTFPCSLSYLKIDFVSAASLSGEVYQTLILSQVAFAASIIARNIPKAEVRRYLGYMQKDIDNLNNKREIITGNLIYGLQLIKNRGKYTTYTTHDGKIKTGILLKMNSKIGITEYSEKDLIHRLINLKNPMTFQQVDMYVPNYTVSDDKIKEGDILHIEVPRSRKSGGKYYLDNELIKLTENKTGFISRNENANFVGKFKVDKIKDVLDRLRELGVVFEFVDVGDETGKKK